MFLFLESPGIEIPLPIPGGFERPLRAYMCFLIGSLKHRMGRKGVLKDGGGALIGRNGGWSINFSK